MFNNLINIHEFYTIIRKGPRAFWKVILKLFLSEQEKIKDAWTQTSGPPTNCWDIPLVQARWNRLISGNPRVDYSEYVAQKYLGSRSSLSALSFGCGTGARELRWAELRKFRCIDAYDLSAQRINVAIDCAREYGVDNIINYRVGDVYRIDMREEYYDIVFAEGSLHHFSPLEVILSRVDKFLKPDGYFIVNEFVGPTRFQWSDRQLQVINGVLSVLPAKYKSFWDSNSLKNKVFKPSHLNMIISDPSEAIESSEILSLLHENFEIVEIKAYGGMILHMLLNGIAHHFISDDDETQRWLNICFDIEDVLLASGELQSDYVVAVCRKFLV